MILNRKIKNIIFTMIMTIVSVIVLIPIYYLLVTTFKTTSEAQNHPMALPTSIEFTKYIEAFKKMQYPRAFMNTAIITVFTVIGVVVITSMCAYALHRSSKKRISGVLFLILMSGMMFPYQMCILGLYKVVQTLNLMNTRLVIILIDITVAIPYSTFLFKAYMSTIPIELEEAARIDGCSVFATFRKIVFPLMKPMVATVATLRFLATWNDFMGPLYFIQRRERDVLLQEVYRNIGQFSVDWGIMFPMMVLSLLPIIIVYIFMQRFIIEGVMSGSIKG